MLNDTAADKYHVRLSPEGISGYPCGFALEFIVRQTTLPTAQRLTRGIAGTHCEERSTLARVELRLMITYMNCLTTSLLRV